MKKQIVAVLIGSLLSLNTACAAETQTDLVNGDNAVDLIKSKTNENVAIKASFAAPDSAWRELDPENTLYIDTDHGRVVVELYPEIAPIHVERIKTLTKQTFYDQINFHRVIEGFMNQTGDPKGDGTGDSELPDIPGEFTFRRSSDMAATLFSIRSKDASKPNAGQVDVGFYKALPIATDPIGQAILTKDGKVSAYGLHCKGVTSMARTADPKSANSQFFLMRGAAPHLDAQYSVWGTTVYGHENLTKIKVGSKSEDSGFIPDQMKRVRIAADLPDEERMAIQIMKTDSPAFKTFLKKYKKDDGNYKDICDVEIPTRLKP